VTSLMVAASTVDHRAQLRKAAGLERLLAAGTLLDDVGPGLAVRWRAESRETEILAVSEDSVVTVSEVRGSQLVVGRSLATGVERWRSTFALQLGSSRCHGPTDPEGSALVVCALRARSRAIGAPESGTALHVRDLDTGVLLAERFSPDALVDARLVGKDLLGAWWRDGTLEVRREEAVSGHVHWRVQLETLEPIARVSEVAVDDVAGELIVGTERDVFAVTRDGTISSASSVSPPWQPQRLALRPVGDGYYALWRASLGHPADLVEPDGRTLLAAVGTPRRLAADDGSLGTVLFALHPDGDILWDVPGRTKLWVARDEVGAGLVVDGVLVLETETGLRAADPARGSALWRAPRVSRLLGLAGDVVGLESESLAGGSAFVGIDPHTGRESWRSPASVPASSRFVVVGGQLFAVGPDGVSLLASPGAES